MYNRVPQAAYENECKFVSDCKNVSMSKISPECLYEKWRYSVAPDCEFAKNHSKGKSIRAKTKQKGRSRRPLFDLLTRSI